MNDQITEIPIDEIHPAEWQPRIDFDDESLNELAQSLKEKGLIQPIVVREHEDGYEIIAGERRYRAWEMLDNETIPAIIKDVDNFEAKEISIIENWQRQDLTDHEKEKFIYHLWLEGSMNDKYTSHSDMSRKTGIPRRTIDMIILAVEEKNSISNGRYRPNVIKTFEESSTDSLARTKALKYDVETRTEVLTARAEKKIDQKDLRQVSKAIVDAPQEARKEIVNLISTEQLKPSEVESFVKSINDTPKETREQVINLVKNEHLESEQVETFVEFLNETIEENREEVINLVKKEHLDVKDVTKFANALKQSPEDVQKKLLSEEITPEEAMEVNTFKTSEQREIVMEENKVIREVAEQDRQRNINVRTQQVKDMEEGKPGEIIDSRIEKMGSDERYTKHIKKILGDIGINIKLKRIQDMENKEYRNECIFLLKKINEHTTNLLIELGEITEV